MAIFLLLTGMYFEHSSPRVVEYTTSSYRFHFLVFPNLGFAFYIPPGNAHLGVVALGIYLHDIVYSFGQF